MTSSVPDSIENQMAKLTVTSSIDGESKPSVPNSPILLAFYYLLFMVMGSGANWVYATALAQEIPYFENHAPEQLCVATYMNATTNFGLIMMGLYLYYHNYVKPIPYSISVPFMLWLSVFGCFFSSAVYGINAGGVSYMLYICCAIGGTVGALASVVMNPFMTQYENMFISAARSGGSSFILLCALLSFAQDPGANNQRFSVTVYLCIFGVLMTFTVMSYYYITINDIGKRSKQANDHLQTVELSEIPLDISSIIHNKSSSSQSHSKHDIEDNHNPLQSNNDSLVSDSRQVNTPSDVTSSSTTPTEIDKDELNPDSLGNHELENIILATKKNFLQPYLTAFTHYIISDKLHKQYPWLRETVPYMMTVGWTNFNTWGIVTAVIPFAMANISEGSGSVNLSIAYQIAAFLLALGDFSTTFFQLPIFPSLVIFTAFCATIYAAAITGVGFQNAAAPVIVIIVYSIERFLEAHVVTSSYRAIATRFPIVHRQSASRAVGISDQVSTTLGALVSTLFVSLAFSCSGGVDDD